MKENIKVFNRILNKEKFIIFCENNNLEGIIKEYGFKEGSINLNKELKKLNIEFRTTKHDINRVKSFLKSHESKKMTNRQKANSLYFSSPAAYNSYIRSHDIEDKINNKLTASDRKKLKKKQKIEKVREYAKNHTLTEIEKRFKFSSINYTRSFVYNNDIIYVYKKDREKEIIQQYAKNHNKYQIYLKFDQFPSMRSLKEYLKKNNIEYFHISLKDSDLDEIREYAKNHLAIEIGIKYDSFSLIDTVSFLSKNKINHL